MTSTTHPGSDPRPRSPWTGSHHIAQHRWQLDHVVSLPEVVDALTDLAAELTDAHRAGWWLAEPMRGGHLVAARASRRERGRGVAGPAATAPECFVRPGPWRLRVVDEVPAPGMAVFDSGSAPLTPVLAWTGRSLEQVSGPAVPATDVAEAVRQVTPTGLAHRLWGVARAHVGPNLDLVAHGGGLRVHAVRDGVLLRTREALTFRHAADGAESLAQAPSAYEELARTAAEMAAAGGRLLAADDGLVLVSFELGQA